MSVAYEPRFHDDSPYAPVGENGHDHDHDHDHSDLNKYINTEANVDMADLAAATYEPSGGEPSPFDASSPDLDLGPIAPPDIDPTNVPVHEASPATMDGDTMTTTPPRRSNPIPKPDRPITRNEDGQYVCQYPGCTEVIKTFNRKCEWNKHMDKHERPYICTVPGCEKVQGFTYSGGLLRHEREVHGKHGGPKKSMWCPHPNCKRSTLKGFSRLENLQEHLRRCHTDANARATTISGATTISAATAAHQQLVHSPEQEQAHGAPSPEDNTSDMASAAFAFIHANSRTPDDSLVTLDGGNDDNGEGGNNGINSTGTQTQTATPLKRKRRNADDADDENARSRAVLAEENETLRNENAELRRQLHEQARHIDDMRTQLQAVNAAVAAALATQQTHQPPAL